MLIDCVAVEDEDKLVVSVMDDDGDMVFESEMLELADLLRLLDTDTVCDAVNVDERDEETLSEALREGDNDDETDSLTEKETDRLRETVALGLIVSVIDAVVERLNEAVGLFVIDVEELLDAEALGVSDPLKDCVTDTENVAETVEENVCDVDILKEPEEVAVDDTVTEALAVSEALNELDAVFECDTVSVALRDCERVAVREVESEPDNVNEAEFDGVLDTESDAEILDEALTLKVRVDDRDDDIVADRVADVDKD